MNRTSVVIILLASALAVGGCSHVKLEPEAEAVRPIPDEEMSACKRLGKTRVKVLSKVLIFHRGAEKVARELEMMARNEAVLMEGNAVAPESEIEGGRQTFGIYLCPVGSAAGDEVAS
jgi:hypothetical protein